MKIIHYRLPFTGAAPVANEMIYLLAVRDTITDNSVENGFEMEEPA